MPMLNRLLILVPLQKMSIYKVRLTACILFIIVSICVVIGDQLIAKRRNERFKRIKCSTLARLLRESLAEESIYQLNRDGPISGDVQASDSVSQRGAQQPMMAA